MELWDVLDERGEPTGRMIVRGQPLRPGEYHLAVHIWVVDDRGRFLVQQRSPQVALFPSIWATTGGSAVAGEQSRPAALRELREELGLSVEASRLQLLQRIRRTDSLLDVWMLHQPVDLAELELQAAEVSAAAWIDQPTLRRMLADGEFHDYGADYFALVFAAAERISGEGAVELSE